MSEVIKYYDEYIDRQAKIGINKRHLSIQKNLERFGLKKNHSVLEIGCGIGTQTKLLAEYLNPSSKITAVDISPKSVEFGKNWLKKFTNIEWIAADIIEHPVKEEYDVILLPDVIEHIPVELHAKLMERVKNSLKKDGFVLIHIPQPYYQEWCFENKPEALQVIDQAIYSNDLLKAVYAQNLTLWHLETYSIWKENGDYQVIVLKHYRKDLNYNPIPQNVSIWKRVKYKLNKMFN